MISTLRNQFVRISLTLLTIVMLLSFVMIYLSTWVNVRAEQEQIFREVLSELDVNQSLFTQSYQSEEPQKRPETSTIISGITSSHITSFILFVDQNNQLSHGWSLHGLPADFYESIFQKTWANQQKQGVLQYAGQVWKYALVTFGMSSESDQTQISPYQLLVFADVTLSHARLHQLLVTYAIAGPITFALLALICFLLSNRALQPVIESWRKQRQFLTDASHELKTPLTSITANLGALEVEHDVWKEEEQRWIENIKHDLSRMKHLVSDMLYLARTEDIRSVHLEIDISHLCEVCVAQVEARIYESQLHIKTYIEEHIHVTGQEERLQQVLMILLDNAIKYCIPDGTITIRLSRTDACAVLYVSNSSRGIDDKDVPFLFDRFYRSDQSRNSTTGGYGLGLAIAKSIIDGHNGKIWMTQDVDVVTFCISLQLLGVSPNISKRFSK